MHIPLAAEEADAVEVFDQLYGDFATVADFVPQLINRNVAVLADKITDQVGKCADLLER